MDEARNQINDLEHEEEKKVNQNSKKKKEFKKNKDRREDENLFHKELSEVR